MRTPKEIIEQEIVPVYGHLTLKNWHYAIALIGEIQTEAYNQALEDACDTIDPRISLAISEQKGAILILKK